MTTTLKFSVSGFSLIEVMAVVAIISIITAIAYPSYTSSVVKAHRTAAKSCLTEYAQYMERYHTSNMAYDQTPTGKVFSLPVLSCSTQSNIGQRYTFTIDTLSRSTFRLLATPIGVQLNHDKECAILTLNQDGTRTASGTAGAAVCW